jgi:hypothetical protein
LRIAHARLKNNLATFQFDRKKSGANFDIEHKIPSYGHAHNSDLMFLCVLMDFLTQWIMNNFGNFLTEDFNAANITVVSED